MPKTLWMLSPISSIGIVLYLGIAVFLNKPYLPQTDFTELTMTTIHAKDALAKNTKTLKKQVSLVNKSLKQAKSGLNSVSGIPSISFGEEPPMEMLFAEIEQRDNKIKSQVKMAEGKINSFSKELNKSKEIVLEIEKDVNDKLNEIENKIKEIETNNPCSSPSIIPFLALIVATLTMLPSWIQLWRKE